MQKLSDLVYDPDMNVSDYEECSKEYHEFGIFKNIFWNIILSDFSGCSLRRCALNLEVWMWRIMKFQAMKILKLAFSRYLLEHHIEWFFWLLLPKKARPKSGGSSISSRPRPRRRSIQLDDVGWNLCRGLVISGQNATSTVAVRPMPLLPCKIKV